jgi:hypothetical protein
MDSNPIYKFPENTKFFLKNLEETTNHKIYYFGSSTRLDYIQGCDIDMAMFTDNIPSLISQIIGLLNIGNEFKKIVHKEKNLIVNGHKLIYTNNDINIELVVYDNKFKDIMLEFYKRSANIPLTISIFLLLLKYLHKFGILNKKMYYKIKKFLFVNFCASNNLVVFN